MSRKELNIGFWLFFLWIWIIYRITVAPTVSFWDCGEYLSCANILGIPHPPGSPLHVLLRKFAMLIIPARDVALRSNLLSTILGAISATFIYYFILRIIIAVRKNRFADVWDHITAHTAAFSGATIGALSFTPWWNAVESEAYVLATFLIMFNLFLAIKWYDHKDEPAAIKYILLIAYLSALSVTVHFTGILAAPAVLLFALFVRRQYLKPYLKEIIMLIVLYFIILGVIRAYSAKPWRLDFTMAGAVLFGITLLGLLPYWDRMRRSVHALILPVIILTAWTPYFYLKIRAAQEPPINEVAPKDWKSIMRVFNREQYGKWYFFPRNTQIKTGYSLPRAFYEQFKFYGRYLLWQYGVYPRETAWNSRQYPYGIRFISLMLALMFIFGGFWGMFLLYKYHPELFVLLFTVYFLTSAGVVLYINFKFSPSDPNPRHEPDEVRERHYFFGASFLLFGIFLGIAGYEILSQLRRYRKAIIPVLAIMGVVPLIFNMYSHANRHNLYIAEDYGYNLLASCRDNSVLFTNGDNDTFPLWFVQWVRGFKQSVRIANLSLLNTDWFIIQLKKELAKDSVFLSFSDYEIHNLLPMPMIKDDKFDPKHTIQIQDIAMRDIIASNAGIRFEKTVPAYIRREFLPPEYQRYFSPKEVIISPSDYTRVLPKKYWVMLPREYLIPAEEFAQLVCTNYKGRIPIYISMTVARSVADPYQPYLRWEGMVQRLVPKGSAGFDLTRTDSLLNKVYRYRSIFDKNVQKDDKTLQRLLANYTTMYFLLGMEYYRRGQYARAAECFTNAERFSKRATQYMPVAYYLREAYLRMGAPDKLVTYIEEKQKRGEPLSAEDYFWLGESYRLKGDIIKAEENYRMAQATDANSPYGYYGLAHLYLSKGDVDKTYEMLRGVLRNPNVIGGMYQIAMQRGDTQVARFVLERWVEANPYDTLAKRLLERLKQE
ncbi:hypothetical protein CGW93_03640 [candidate division bacterium WOR-3 4484_18]|uniref:Uncharacterized protein n=1 Tax=candidate division WOR-3 bacterium 4484_18 TaxID=2020626 RepID=A0A257LT15_UNCW3|nr:MAG: hypothetical protein CGW93_03640 [candidate division bacterium WOR-3 4484_18]